MLQINKNSLSFILLFLLGIIWGSSFLFIKFTVYSLQPLTAVLLRMAVASLCLLLYLKINKIVLPLKKRHNKLFFYCNFRKCFSFFFW